MGLLWSIDGVDGHGREELRGVNVFAKEVNSVKKLVDFSKARPARWSWNVVAVVPPDVG